MSTSSTDITDARRLTLTIPADLHRRIRVQAAREDKSMNAWIRAWLLTGVTYGEKEAKTDG